MRNSIPQQNEPITRPLTTAELAWLIHYHPESIRRLIRDGIIRAMPFGRTYRIPPDVVNHILTHGLPAGGAR